MTDDKGVEAIAKMETPTTQRDVGHSVTTTRFCSVRRDEMGSPKTY